MISNQQIFSEMLAHVPVCTHRMPKNVLVIGDFEGEVAKQLTIHTDIETITVLQSQVCELDIFGHEKCSVITQESVGFLTDCEPKSFDVVILNADASDPFYDSLFYGLINRILKDDGVFASVCANAITQSASFEDLCVKLEKFTILMPSFFMQSQGIANIVIASKKYHPTADLILQRSDLLEGLEYYNAEVHNASFVMPNFLKERFRTIVKI